MAKILNIDGAKLNIDSTNMSDNYALQPKTRIVRETEDLNNCRDAGFYKLKGSVINLPSGYGWGHMLVIYDGYDTGIQIIFSIYGNPPAYRSWSSNGATFSDWFYLSQTT